MLVANERTRQALPTSLKHVKTRVLVENGVDLSLWTDRPMASVATQVGATTRFVYMGRLVDWKAVDILITAFAAASKNANVALTIIGDGDQRAELELLARGLDVLGSASESGKVSFMGWKSQAECAQYLQNSDALVLTSLMECGGAVVLEAMAMGLPVIATNWGGPADYIDASCGLLITPTDRATFTRGVADALQKLANDPDMRANMGKAGRTRVEREFDWEIKVDRMLEIYRSEVGVT